MLSAHTGFHCDIRVGYDAWTRLSYPWRVPIPDGKKKPPPEGPLGEHTTRKLLREAKAGDQQAIDRLFERARGPLMRWARGRFPAWARYGLDTDDLVNDALANTFRRLTSFEPRHDGAFHAYLCRAVANRIRDEKEKAKKRGIQHGLNEGGADGRPSPEDEAMAHEAFERYEAALEKLPPEAREAVRMRVDLQFSYKGIKEALGKPTANAARMTVTRAIAALAREMGRER